MENDNQTSLDDVKKILSDRIAGLSSIKSDYFDDIELIFENSEYFENQLKNWSGINGIVKRVHPSNCIEIKKKSYIDKEIFNNILNSAIDLDTANTPKSKNEEQKRSNEEKDYSASNRHLKESEARRVHTKETLATEEVTRHAEETRRANTISVRWKVSSDYNSGWITNFEILLPNQKWCSLLTYHNVDRLVTLRGGNSGPDSYRETFVINHWNYKPFEQEYNECPGIAKKKRMYGRYDKFNEIYPEYSRAVSIFKDILNDIQNKNVKDRYITNKSGSYDYEKKILTDLAVIHLPYSPSLLIKMEQMKKKLPTVFRKFY